MYTKVTENTKGWAGLFTMIEYFGDDPKSLEAIRTTRPHDLMVCPDIFIRLNRKNPANLAIIKVYPNKQEVQFVGANIRAVNKLRDLFKNKKSLWTSYLEKDYCVFHLEGKVVRANRAFYKTVGLE